jgi:hypothetical protein
MIAPTNGDTWRMPARNKISFCGFTNEEIIAIEADIMRLNADCVLDAWVIFYSKTRKAKKGGAGKIWALLLAKLKTDESRGEGVALAIKLFAKIARDLARDAYRHESKSASLPADIETRLGHDPIANIDNHLDAEFLLRALRRHSAAEHEAVKLIVLEDKPIKEAAKEMNCTLAAAKERKLRGIRYLQLYANVAEKHNNIARNGLYNGGGVKILLVIRLPFKVLIRYNIHKRGKSSYHNKGQRRFCGAKLFYHNMLICR